MDVPRAHVPMEEPAPIHPLAPDSRAPVPPIGEVPLVRPILTMDVSVTLAKMGVSVLTHQQVSDSLAPVNKAGTETRARRTF